MGGPVSSVAGVHRMTAGGTAHTPGPDAGTGALIDPVALGPRRFARNGCCHGVAKAHAELGNCRRLYASAPYIKRVASRGCRAVRARHSEQPAAYGFGAGQRQLRAGQGWGR